MKIIIAILCLIALLCGCTTTQVQTTDAGIVAATPIVQPIVKAAIDLGLGYLAHKNGTDLATLKAQIQPIADKVNRGSTLAAATAGNLITPTQFCELMKVQDDDLTRVLQTLVPMYSQLYVEWKQDPTNEKIFAYSKCILDGLALLSGAAEQATR